MLPYELPWISVVSPTLGVGLICGPKRMGIRISLCGILIPRKCLGGSWGEGPRTDVQESPSHADCSAGLPPHALKHCLSPAVLRCPGQGAPQETLQWNYESASTLPFFGLLGRKGAIKRDAWWLTKCDAWWPIQCDAWWPIKCDQDGWPGWPVTLHLLDDTKRHT